MLIDKSSLSRRTFVIAVLSAFAPAGISSCRALPVNAQQDVSPLSAPVSTYQSHSSEEDHAHSDATHRYSSEADRAKDALLITEVKTALANDGVTDGHAVVVDCDHGTVLLTGAVGSSADAQHAVAVASRVDGVVAVKNHLKW
jgi:osmotically-inducible protein OsmY